MRVIFYLLTFFFILAKASAQEISADQLPEGNQTGFPAFESIQNLEFPLTKEHQIALGAGAFVSDKFINSNGLHLLYSYFKTRDFSYEAGVSSFSLKLSEDVVKYGNSSTRPILSSPKWMVRGGIVYRPVYGKFVVGRYLQRFLFGPSAGIHIASIQRMRGKLYQILDSELSAGPYAGARILLPFTEHFSLEWSSELFYHRDWAQGGTRLSWGHVLFGAYRFK